MPPQGIFFTFHFSLFTFLRIFAAEMNRLTINKTK